MALKTIAWDTDTNRQVITTVTPGAGSGETNTGANVGTGEGEVFRDKTGVTLNFKKIQAGANITVTNNADEIVIAATGGGGGLSLAQAHAVALSF